MVNRRHFAAAVLILAALSTDECEQGQGASQPKRVPKPRPSVVCMTPGPLDDVRFCTRALGEGW